MRRTLLKREKSLNELTKSTLPKIRPKLRIRTECSDEMDTLFVNSNTDRVAEKNYVKLPPTSTSKAQRFDGLLK